ncbi:MAG: glycyl-radical enzyme activating protein [Eubacteriaceae bacterium]|nr:glycyl-radical enzyme activating protein [Eubacteriaceae bacterium]
MIYWAEQSSLWHKRGVIKMKTATIFNIQKFSIHDGPGIRTTIFFKGCPLKCLWCANPESQDTKPVLEVFPKNCIGCGECVKTCAVKAISFSESGINVDRVKCKTCKACAKQCYSKTLKMVGENKTVDEVVEEIKKDEVFYKNSGGGFTFSGGEPLEHGDFCIEVMDKCSRFGFNSAIETSGYGNTGTMIEMAKRLDVIFYDIKHMDSTIHEKLTGVKNELILKNLREIQPYAKEIIVRIPVIRGLNDDLKNIRATAVLCKDLKAVKQMELLPYHRLGEHKYEAIGRTYQLTDAEPPSQKGLMRLAGAANDILEPEGKICKIEASGRK